MKEVVKNIKNHFRINDWVQLANGRNGDEKWYVDYDKLKSQVDDHGRVLSETVCVGFGIDV